MPEKDKLGVTDEIKDLLNSVFKSCERDNSWIRHGQVALWKKLEEYYHGNQFIWWDEVASDWRSYSANDYGDEESRDNSGPLYDYVINIIKPHADSIIAALTQDIPVLEFFPEDADNIDDITTAKTKTKIAVIIQKHNKGKLVLMDALYKAFNQGLLCGLVRTDYNKSYGTYKVPIMKAAEENNENSNENEETSLGEETKDTQKTICIGEKEHLKSRQILEVFGPLNVKVPYYARKQEEFGYIELMFEVPIDKAREKFPDFYAEIQAGDSISATERWARTPSTYTAGPIGLEDMADMVTLRYMWLRPEKYNILPEKEKADKLKAKYPEGVRIAKIGETIVEIEDDPMDETWVIKKIGPSSHIHSDPVGLPLLSINEMRNVVVNLAIQTIEYGIPSEFADPEVLNFDEYSATEASPGFVFPAKPKPGSSLESSFYTTRTATLSKEVQPFGEKLDQDAQFTVGDFPAIYGGPSEGKSRTLGEYERSRVQALQRLSILWEYVRIWWSEFIELAVNNFISELISSGMDEYTYPIKENGLYSNVVIRLEDLEGKAHVDSEASSDFPISSQQKRQIMLQFLQMQNDVVNQIFMHPENIKNMSEALGFPDLYIPGEDQRFKQLVEIAQLANIDPTVTESDELPTVHTEPDVDDANIHIAILKVYLSSERGQDLKRSNPAAYVNIAAHLKMHLADEEQKMQQQMQQQQQLQNQGVQ